MSTNKSDKNQTNVVTNCHNESIGIAFNIENNAIVGNNTDVTMSSLDIGWILPIGVR
jgi:hypothetical protein